MRSIICIALLLGIAAPMCLAQDDFPIFVYPCPQAKAPPTIDGVLDDACWKDPPIVTGFTLYDKPVVVEVQTALQVTYDAQRLYFGIVCDEPMPDKLPLAKSARDDHAVFGQEAIEVFVDPKHSHADYYQIAVAVGRGVYDGHLTDPSWNGAVETATHVGLGQWSVEMAIPWADLGVAPAAGAVIGFNVCRDRNLAGVRTWSNWSQTKANFHDPLRFAHLVLSPTPEQLGKLGNDFRKGERSGPIRIFSTEGFSETSYREIAKQALTLLESQLAELDKACADEEDPATKAELAKRIAVYREQLAASRQRIEGPEAVNAVAWTKMERELNAMSASLAAVVWEARLSALLSGI